MIASSVLACENEIPEFNEMIGTKRCFSTEIWFKNLVFKSLTDWLRFCTMFDQLDRSKMIISWVYFLKTPVLIRFDSIQQSNWIEWIESNLITKKSNQHRKTYFFSSFFKAPARRFSVPQRRP